MSPNSNRKVKRSAAKTKSRNQMLGIVAAIAIIAIIIVGYVALSQNNTGATNPTPSPSATASSTVSPSVTPLPTAAPALTSPVSQYSANGTQVLLETSMGNIIIQLRDDKPITTTNFVNLINQGVYDGTLFHRVMAGFMVQGGVNESASLSTINDEIGTDNRNTIGTITMAKTYLANSATSSFFINVADNSQIHYQDGTTFDGTYSVFGKVISGMTIVNAMSNVPVTTNPNMGNENSKPQTDITLIRAVILS